MHEKSIKNKTYSLNTGAQQDALLQEAIEESLRD